MMNNCLLWHDGIAYGCVDIDGAIGRNLFRAKYEFMPRELLLVTPAGNNYWMLTRLTDREWIAVEFYDRGSWQALQKEPKAIDDNTLIRVIFHEKFTFRCIFIGGISCKDASILEDVWTSPIWDKNLGTTLPTAAMPAPLRIEQRAMTVLEWWALYLKNNTYAALAAILIAGIGIYLWLKK